MYILEKAKIKNNKQSGKWNIVPLFDLELSTILTSYAEVYFYIRHPGPAGGTTVGLLLSNIRTRLSSSDQTQTFQDWLDSIGNEALPFEDELLEGKINYVRYVQAWHSGYNAMPFNSGMHINSNIPNSRKHDLLLTHPTRDIRDFTKKALVTVNGYFHPCDTHPDGVTVLGGGSNVYNYNDNQIGIYSFETVGDLSVKIIQSDWISKGREDSDLYNGFYVTLPEDINIDESNKTVLLVMGGYLIAPGDVYYRVSERTYKINTPKLMLLDRIYQSRKAMGLESLDLFPERESPTLTSSKKLEDDEVILNYVLGTNSFFVILDSPGFFQELRPLENIRLPGRSLETNYDRLPIMGAYGRMIDYHVIKEPMLNNHYHSKDQIYVVQGTVNLRNHYDNNKSPWRGDMVFNGGRNSYNPFTHDTYFYRLMGVER